MLLALVFINIILFYAGVCIVVNKQVAELHKGIRSITSIIIVFILISYAWYLSLVFKTDILILTGVLSLINIVLIGTNFTAYKNFIKAKSGKSANNTDALFPLFIVLLLTGFFCAYTERWGKGDAIIIWDIHAKFLFDGKILFANTAAPDHPLMLPGLVAFFWRLINNMSPVVPAFVVYLPLIFIPLLSYFSISQDKNKWFAWLALAIFALSSNYVIIACSQGADTMLALLILMTFILYAHLNSTSKNILYFVGFMGAASMWVKNEGILFFVVFTLIFLLNNYKNIGHLKNYAIGTIIPLGILLSFKIFYSPTNDLVGNAAHTGALLHNVLNYHRYIFIGRFLFSILFHYYIDVLILLFLTLIINPLFFKSPPFIIIAIIFVGYFMIYTTSPYDLQWHLSTSYDRILQHFYPALVFSILFSMQNWYSKKAIGA